MTSGAAPVDTLRERVAGGLRWKLLSQVVAQGSRTGVGIALARLLTPHDFGLAAMALIFTSVGYIFTDLSLGSALIQRRQITETDRSTVFWTSVSAGSVMTLIGIALAPAAGAFFNTSEVVPLFAAASCLTLISALDTTQTALLTREMRFRSLEIRQIVATLIGAAAAVAMALAGFGAWTIIGQTLVTAVVSVVLVWRLSGWRPRWTYSRTSLQTFGSFGIKTLAAKLLGYVITYTDNLLIGRYLGTRALGVYSVAYNVMFLPLSRIAEPIQVVFYTAFAKLQDDPRRLGRAWLRGTELITAVTVPAFLGLAIVAPDFIPVVLGERWKDAVPVLQLLSLAGLAYSFQTLNWSVIQAMGQPGRTLRFMVFAAAITVGAFIVGLHWGIVGVAGLFAVARAISMAVFTWTTCRTIDLRVWDFIRNVRWVVVMSLTMAGAVLAARAALVSAAVSAGPRLVVLVVVGVGVYGGLVAWLAPRLVADIRSVLRPSASASPA